MSTLKLKEVNDRACFLGLFIKQIGRLRFNNTYKRQECIPVGCVLPARNRTAA